MCTMAGLEERVSGIVLDTVLAIVFFIVGMVILSRVTEQPFGFHGNWHQISGDITFCAMCAGFPLGLRLVRWFRSVYGRISWSFFSTDINLMLLLQVGYWVVKYILLFSITFIAGVFTLIYISIHHAVILIRMLLLERKIRSLQAMPAELQAVLPAEQLAVEPQIEVGEDVEDHREG